MQEFEAESSREQLRSSRDRFTGMWYWDVLGKFCTEEERHRKTLKTVVFWVGGGVQLWILIGVSYDILMLGAALKVEALSLVTVLGCQHLT